MTDHRDAILEAMRRANPDREGDLDRALRSVDPKLAEKISEFARKLREGRQ